MESEQATAEDCLDAEDSLDEAIEYLKEYDNPNKSLFDDRSKMIRANILEGYFEIETLRTIADSSPEVLIDDVVSGKYEKE
tara:strand:- start:152 stop:394 length:243 start_codon:yes stop_codon:yes gene_type:complete